MIIQEDTRQKPSKNADIRKQLEALGHTVRRFGMLCGDYQIFGKGYLYKGKSIQPYSPAAGTGLSSHELNQPGCYRDVKDTTCCAQFKVVGEEDLYFLASGLPAAVPRSRSDCHPPCKILHHSVCRSGA